MREVLSDSAAVTEKTLEELQYTEQVSIEDRTLIFSYELSQGGFRSCGLSWPRNIGVEY